MTAKPELKPKDAPDLSSFDWEDAFRLEDQLTEEERLLRDAARTYAQKALQPRVIEAFNDEVTDPAIFTEMGEMGLLGITIPEEYGGLGAGYVEAEFVVAGLPFPKPSARLQLLKEHITEIRRQLSDPANTPPSVQKPPPIMVAGMGDRMLAMAAQHADIVAVGGMGGEAAVAERAAYILNQAGVLADDIELAFSFFQVSLDDRDDLSVLRQVAPDASEVDLREAATLLDGTVSAAVDRVQRLREANFSYFTFHKTEATSWDTLAKLTSALK